jgi:hypothetical protein
MGVRVACALLSYTLLAAPGRARAERAVRLETLGALPFSSEELDQVVRARIPVSPAADAAPVVVGPAGDDGILVRVGDKIRAVGTDDRTGVAAARLVALVIADLAAAEIVPAPIIRRQAEIPTPAPRPGPLLSSALEVSRGTGASEPTTFGVAADLLAERGWWLAGGGLGVWGTPTQNAGRPDEASAAGGAARLWAGAKLGALAALVGPVVVPYHLGGSVNRSGLLVGGGASLRLQRPLGGRTALLAMVRVDAFANRVQVALDDASSSLATPRVALAIGLGLTWDLGW